MDGASAITILGLLFKVFEFCMPKQKEALAAPVAQPTASAPYDKDAAILCLSVVAIVAIVAIMAIAASRQSA